MKFRWRRREEEALDDEIRFHFEEEMKDRISAGMPAADAEAEVRRAFGNVTQVKEVTRAMWGWNAMEQVLRDGRYAVRTLRQAPLFTLTAVLSLGLGIGANLATFSFADAALFRPMPGERPGEIIAISGATAQKAADGISYQNYVDIRERAQSFSGVVAHSLGRYAFGVSRDVLPQMKFGMQVSRGCFSILGVQAALGRTFTDEESGTPGRDAVIVLSHDLWREQFGRNAGVIGSTVYLNGIGFTVIGVMPEWFTGMDAFLRPSFYVPLTMAGPLRPAGGGSLLEDRGFHVLNVHARLKTGATLDQAQAELTAIARSLESEHPNVNRGRSLRARTQFQLRIQESPPITVMVAMLLTLAMLVLAISCANVASLLLARTRARSREIAIRLAIGAGRGRLISQFLTESLLLASLGGVVGLGLAYSVVRFLAAIRLPTDTPIGIPVQVDARLMLFGLFVSAVSAVLFGVIPALLSLRPNVAPSLKTVVADGQTRNLGRSILVAAQVALALVLLVTSSAMLDAFRRMLVLDPGIRTSRLVMFEFDPGMIGYAGERVESFYKQLMDRTRSMPGVRSATLARAFPFRPNFTEEAIVPEGYQMPSNQTSVSISTNVVDEQYFETMGTAIVKGRGFTTADGAASRRVAVVNAEFAKRYWPGSEPVGKRFRLRENGAFVEVIGVARTGKYLSMAETPQPYVYLPLTQNPRIRRILVVQTEGDPSTVMNPVLKAIHELDPGQPVFNIRTIENYIEQGVMGPALILIQMVGATGLIGLALTMVGLYGLVAYSVSRRTREIGIRMALGAGRGSVLSLVLRQGLKLSAIGIGAGLAVSIPIFRLLSSGLAGLGELSPLTLLIVPCGLMLVTMCACSIPAYRACRIDATRALRCE
jgi:putative ABC transport system permease protein